MNWLDLLITVCIGIGLIKGLFDGFIKQVISLISLVLAIFFAGTLAKPIRELFYQFSIINNTFPDYIITGVCYVFAFVVIIFGFSLIGKLFEEAIKKTPGKGFNHLFGGLLGVMKWIFFLSLIFTLLTVFDPNCKIISKQTELESVLYNKIRRVVPTLYPYVKHYLKLDEMIPGQDEKKDEKDEPVRDEKTFSV